MDEPKKQLVKSWLTKAQHDLGSAQLLANNANPYFDTAIYHCQQAAEKALKAFLVYHDTDFEKKHNLSVLVDLCVPIALTFENFRETAAILTPYATAFRYPGEFFEAEPDKQQVNNAIELAQRLLEFVLNQLPAEVRP
jgi:HEPN domain-containing protein